MQLNTCEAQKVIIIFKRLPRPRNAAAHIFPKAGHMSARKSRKKMGNTSYSTSEHLASFSALFLCSAIFVEQTKDTGQPPAIGSWIRTLIDLHSRGSSCFLTESGDDDTGEKTVSGQWRVSIIIFFGQTLTECLVNPASPEICSTKEARNGCGVHVRNSLLLVTVFASAV